jgi:DNA repair protein RadC
MLQLQYAIQSNVNAIIIFHNHPSGKMQPSESDLKITRKIKDSGLLLDIKLLDHLIIIPEGMYHSMTDEGIV